MVLYKLKRGLVNRNAKTMSENKTINIFIIEDDFVFIEILVNLLEEVKADFKNRNINLQIQTFYSTKEAGYELAQKPDVVLLDYFLMDDELQADTGDKIIDVIKKHYPEIDVIVISGQENEEIKKEMIKKGAVEYLGKDKNSLKKIKPLIVSLLNKKFNSD